ncbi:MAG: stage III sporulation protein AD [Lachnospiraceae bacterium]|nr:stage III sporulation protein AD [Lachnospiraceae bacterium]
MNIGVLMSLVIVAIVLAISLKSRNPEISSIIGIAISIVIISLVVGYMGNIVATLKYIYGYINIKEGYFLILLKLIGIAYICEFASGISKDAGYSAVASQIELTGKVTMLVVSLPVLVSVVETVLGMI